MKTSKTWGVDDFTSFNKYQDGKEKINKTWGVDDYTSFTKYQ